MKTTLILIWAIFCVSCSKTNTNQEGSDDKSFSFIFMTDIHLQPEHGYPVLPQTPDFSPHKAFSIAIDTANQLGADFAIMGGDMVYDVTRGQTHADSLFMDYKNAVSALDMPVYHTIGNHDLFGVRREESSISVNQPDYKYGMFERYLGKTYYSFDHKGWHFMVLNSFDVTDKRHIGLITEKQMKWIREDLAEVDSKTPIVVSTHLPLISVQRQIYSTQGTIENPKDQWIINRKEILDVFSSHNLKLVLQGHMHILEDIYIHQSGIHFITGGSIAGRPSWQGFRNGEPSGFLRINIKDQDISWDFIDFGWRDYILDYEKGAFINVKNEIS
jgi:3',5'-cyclic-AMP phosphodiesterase